MTQGRSSHTATLLSDGRILVAGGFAGGVRLSSAEIYDPQTETWSSAEAMSELRTDHTATLLFDGRVLIAGGEGRGILSTAEIYDGAVRSWAKTGSMSRPRSAHTATLLSDRKVLVAGGFDEAFEERSLTETDIFDPAVGSWSSGGDMPRARSIHTATLLSDGRVLVAGGVGSGELLSSAEIYDPSGGRWSSATDMSYPRWSHTATLLIDGRVLVSGGVGETFEALSSAEIYDPATGTWLSTGAMSEPRVDHAATLLSDGRILVAGGTNADILHETFSSAEIYDPATGNWSLTEAMSEARADHTVTLLYDDKVLVVGGMDGVIARSTVEIFDPATGSWSSSETSTTSSTPGERIANQGVAHISLDEGHPSYNSVPATSGWHYGQPLAPVEWGVHVDFVTDEHLVHNLEHGGIGIHYSCPDGCDALVDNLARIVLESTGADLKVLMSPYPDMETRIALTAWNYIDRLDEFDEDRIREFILAHESSLNAPEPFAR